MFIVAVDTFVGVERQRFDNLDSAMTEYNRLVKFGRKAWFYTV